MLQRHVKLGKTAPSNGAHERVAINGGSFGRWPLSLLLYTIVHTFFEAYRNKNISRREFCLDRGEAYASKRERGRETLESHRLWHLGNLLKEEQLSSLIPFSSAPSLIELAFGPRAPATSGLFSEERRDVCPAELNSCFFLIVLGTRISFKRCCNPARVLVVAGVSLRGGS